MEDVLPGEEHLQLPADVLPGEEHLQRQGSRQAAARRPVRSQPAAASQLATSGSAGPGAAAGGSPVIHESVLKGVRHLQRLLVALQLSFDIDVCCQQPLSMLPELQTVGFRRGPHWTT